MVNPISEEEYTARRARVRETARAGNDRVCGFQPDVCHVPDRFPLPVD
jgi:hypothetical protein